MQECHKPFDSICVEVVGHFSRRSKHSPAVISSKQHSHLPSC